MSEQEWKSKCYSLEEVVKKQAAKIERLKKVLSDVNHAFWNDGTNQQDEALEKVKEALKSE